MSESKIQGLHYLRGIAATMVVCFHAAELQRLHGMDVHWPSYVLARGVDVFFVISGYLMVHVTRHGARPLDFFRNRLLRVGPLYWVLTLCFGLAILARPSLSEKPVDMWVLLKSLLFLPSPLGAATIQTTIISVGWTLVYEMFFYALFAISLALGVGVRALVAFLVLLVAVHPWAQGFYASLYTYPILLEFAAGMLIARAPRMPARWAAPVFVVGVVALLGGSLTDGLPLALRPATFGTGAALMVLAALSLPLPGIGVLNALGDASYSIYLTHLYFMKYVGLKIASSQMMVWVALGLVGGWVVHHALERPLTRLARRWAVRRTPAPPVAA